LETAALVAGLAVFLVLAHWRAFHAPFFGENFQHLGPYRHSGNCLACLLTAPTLDRWFRPVDAVLTVLSHEVLPPLPTAFHARNYLLLLANLLIFHRFLVEIVSAPLARVLAVVLVGVSKVHFTLIGYINIFGGILAVTWTLLAALAFIRFVKHGRYGDYVLVLLTATLAIFSKETGISVLFVLAAILWSFRDLAGKPIWRWFWHLVPIGLAVAAFFAARTVVAGSPFQTSEYYAPRLSAAIVWRDAVAFVASLTNVAFGDHSVMGAGGVGAYLAGRFGLPANYAVAGDLVVVLALCVLLVALALRARGQWRRWVFPLTWMAVVFGMVITIRNLQIYYTYDFIIAFGVLLAALLQAAAPRALGVAATGIAVVALNGLVSNAFALYTWQVVANDAGQGTRAALTACGRPSSCEQVVFVTSRPDYWLFTLGGVPPVSPMLPELLDRPDLEVAVLRDGASGMDLTRPLPGRVVFDVDQGFGPLDPAAAIPSVSLTIIAFGPDHVRVGQPFNTQADGRSALWLRVEKVTPDTVVVFAGTPLLSTVAPAEGLITAIVEAELYSRVGDYPIYLRNHAGQSNEVRLTVEP
jgi:hypothetical protein